MRMSEEQFSWLLEKVTPRIKKQDTRFREALSPRIKLQVTLRYLASGDNLRTLSALYRVPKTTVSRFIPEVCTAVYAALEDFIKVRSRGTVLCEESVSPQFVRLHCDRRKSERVGIANDGKIE